MAMSRWMLPRPAWSSTVGVATNGANASLEAQKIIYEDSQGAVDGLSGVNLDEEAANLLRYQQAYQAAAQMIRVTQTIFDTLISSVRPMSTRISTAGAHAAAIAQILKQQVALSKTQAQVSSGQRIQTPADDPVATTRILGIERAQAQLDQYGRNAGIAADRLNLGEQSLADLAIAAAAGTCTDRAGQQRRDGRCLAAVHRHGTARARRRTAADRQPPGRQRRIPVRRLLHRRAAVHRYRWRRGLWRRPGVRRLQLSSSQSIADGFHGEQVFMGITEGNGTFMVNARHEQPGTGRDHWRDAAINAAQVVNRRQRPTPWRRSLRISDNCGAGRWYCRDSH